MSKMIKATQIEKGEEEGKGKGGKEGERERGRERKRGREGGDRESLWQYTSGNVEERKLAILPSSVVIIYYILKNVF